MTLYSGVAFNPNSAQQRAAQEKLKFLTFKLSELRRLRERTQNLKSHADQKKELSLNRRRIRRTVAYASDFVAAASLIRAAAPIASKRYLGRPMTKKEIKETKERILNHKKQLSFWRRYLQKLRGITSSHDEEEETDTSLEHEDIQRQQGFSAELYRQQMNSRDLSS